MKDKGCFYHRPSCETCPYKDGEISFSAKCVDEYSQGIKGLVTDVRSSVIMGLLEKNFSVTMIAKIFYTNTPNIRKIISRYWERKRADKST